MSKAYKTEQESFWAGEFGNEYTVRNDGPAVIAGNLAMFSKAMSGKVPPASVIEFGANRGLNLRAMAQLFPQAKFTALEINPNAIAELKMLERVTPIHTSILDYKAEQQFDLVLIKGVLIHINPDELSAVYERLYKSTGRYLMVAEYYNPTPLALPYRGHEERLFKRDFAGEIMDKYPDLRLADYGFCYHRDPVFPLGDITWFVLEKGSVRK